MIKQTYLDKTFSKVLCKKKVALQTTPKPTISNSEMITVNMNKHDNSAQTKYVKNKTCTYFDQWHEP